MQINRVIRYKGTFLQVYGKYTKPVPSQDGSLPIKAEFEVNEVYDVSKDGNHIKVTDLFLDLSNEIAKDVLDILAIESIEDADNGDDQSIFNELDAEELANEWINKASEEFIKEVKEVSLPIYWHEDTELFDRYKITNIVTKLAHSMALSYDQESQEMNPIIAGKVSSKGFRLVRLNDLENLQ